MGLDELLNDAGKAMQARIGKQCLNEFAGEYPFARLDDFTTVPDATKLPRVDAVITANDLGQRTPTAPHYVYQSATDELEPVAGIDKLVSTYCAAGVRVQYNRAAAGEHIAFSIASTGAAAGYLADRFDGKPVPDTCPKRAGQPPAASPPTGKPTATAACTSRRAFAVHVRQRYRSRLRSATVRISGKTVARVRRGRALISLKGQNPGRMDVRIVMRLRSGKTIVDTRRYRLCARQGR